MTIARTVGRLLAALVLAAAGCSPGGPGRYQLSGTVTYNDQAIPQGTLLFEPDTERGNSGPGVLVEFKDGHYRTQRGKGVVGGPHRVRITGFDGKGDDRGESMRGRPLFREQVQVIDLPRADAVHDFVIAPVPLISDETER
jgi:hypothetical protein